MGKQLLFSLGRPFSPFYGALMRMRESCYQRGVLKVTHFPLPVISVGNLTLGGTGKTPMVQHLARLLVEHGFKPAVVSRGYGGTSKELVNIVSNGKQIGLSAELIGDEPRLLAETLPGVPVLTGRFRKFPAARAVELGADVLLLDDGFQHMAVARSLDLVLFSADYLAGNSRIFPGGDLREPVSALHRGSAFILTGVHDDNRDRCDRFAALLQERFPGKKVFTTNCLPTGYVLRDGNDRFVELKEKPRELEKAFAFCGIARPESFQATLDQCGITPLDFLSFKDHHVYSDLDLRRIRDCLRRDNASCLVTTEKDMVKLGQADFGLPLYGVRVGVQAEDAFNDMILTAVRARSTEKSSA